jgi:hypothetical protein
MVAPKAQRTRGIKMQAIVTSYRSPTNTVGARILAKATAKRITVPYEYGLSVEKNQCRAAETLAKKMGWAGRWHGGTLPNGDVVFVWVGGGEGTFEVKE